MKVQNGRIIHPTLLKREKSIFTAFLTNSLIRPQQHITNAATEHLPIVGQPQIEATSIES